MTTTTEQPARCTPTAVGVQTPALIPVLLTPRRLDALLCEIRLQRRYAEGQYPTGMPNSQLGQANYLGVAWSAALAVFVLDLGGREAGEAVLRELGMPAEQVPGLMSLLVTSRFPTVAA